MGTKGIKYHHYSLTQAERIIQKFGGVLGLIEALKSAGHNKNASTIYRWTYHEGKGTGGVIPHDALKEVMHAARVQGVFLSNEDLDPRPSTHKKAELTEKIVEKLKGDS